MNIEQDRISDSKLYELILKTKCDVEKQRDEINKYYTSLFTGIVAIMPLIEKFTSRREIGIQDSQQSLQFLLLSLVIVGIFISISWILTLKRIYNYIDSFDKLLIILEEKHNQPFITYINSNLDKVHSPGRITKQTMLLPFVFLIIFSITLLYNLGYMRWLAGIFTVY